MTFVSWVRRHPLSSYFALVFGISWGGILIVLGAADCNLIELRLRRMDIGSIRDLCAVANRRSAYRRHRLRS
jgi:hypothetical protein